MSEFVQPQELNQKVTGPVDWLQVDWTADLLVELI
jgi:hypothetical protein